VAANERQNHTVENSTWSVSKPIIENVTLVGMGGALGDFFGSSPWGSQDRNHTNNIQSFLVVYIHSFYIGTIMKSFILSLLAFFTCNFLVPIHSLAQAPKPRYGGGAGVGRLNLDDNTPKNYQTHYDMVLVERLQKRKAPQEVAEGSLYVPDDDLPRLHLCRVLSVGPGREEENGIVAPNLDGIQPGDLILAKDPWGIGPKDEELSDGTKLSYMRSMNIAAKVTGDLVPDQ
jgi:co-chaperonin GroES (HSP10)